MLIRTNKTILKTVSMLSFEEDIFLRGRRLIKFLFFIFGRCYIYIYDGY